MAMHGRKAGKRRMDGEVKAIDKGQYRTPEILGQRPSQKRLARKRVQRRQQHGSAWHWKQTDSWYYTLPGTKRRMALFDDEGARIKGLANRPAAERSLAKIKVTLA